MRFHSPCQNILLTIQILAKTVVFQFLFLFLTQICILIPYKSGSLRKPHPAYLIGAFARTFSMLQKKAAPERFYISSPATSASKKPSEKSAKKLVRRSLLSDFTYLVLIYFKRVRFSKNKIPNSIPHNWCQQKLVPERPTPTR